MDTKMITEIIEEIMSAETKASFARRVGVKRPTVYTWLRGERSLRLPSVVKLARVANDDQLRRLYAAVGLRLPACERCNWTHPRPLEILCNEERE